MKLSQYLATHSIGVSAFAGMIGVDKSVVSRWANDKRMPRPAHMEKIHRATGGAVTANDFHSYPEAA